MPSPQIRITKSKELMKMLEILKSQLMLLSEAEIVKLALSDFFRRREEERIREWEASLPLMELTDEEQEELTKGIKDLEAGRGRITTANELMEEIRKEAAS